jgi:hypothetical protein
MPGAKSAIAERHRRWPPAALELRGERWLSDADEKVCIEIVHHAQGQAENAHGLCVCLAATNEKVHEAALCDPNYRCVGAAALLWETAEWPRRTALGSPEKNIRVIVTVSPFLSGW